MVLSHPVPFALDEVSLLHRENATLVGQIDAEIPGGKGTEREVCGHRAARADLTVPFSMSLEILVQMNVGRGLHTLLHWTCQVLHGTRRQVPFHQLLVEHIPYRIALNGVQASTIDTLRQILLISS